MVDGNARALMHSAPFVLLIGVFATDATAATFTQGATVAFNRQPILPTSEVGDLARAHRWRGSDDGPGNNLCSGWRRRDAGPGSGGWHGGNGRSDTAADPNPLSADMGR